MTGLQVAPTAPQLMDCPSSSGSAESFHKQVGVVWVMRRSGDSVMGNSYPMVQRLCIVPV